MNSAEDQYAPVVLFEAEQAFERVLEEMQTKDYMQRSFIYMQLACMRAAGWKDAEYEDLMPVSGYGLTFGYHPKEHAEAHYYPPSGTDTRIERATGFGWEYLHFDDIEAYWRAMKETIDSGRPIHAPHMEEVLFVGYQEGGRKEDRRIRPLAIPVFIDPGIWWTWREFEEWFQEFGGPLGRFTERREPRSEKETAVAVLEEIVRMAYDDPRKNNPRFADVRWGLDGIEAFIEDMEDLSMHERDFCSGWFGCHDINSQWMARRLTGRYLERASLLFDDPMRTSIREAAAEYAAAHGAWREWDRHLGSGGRRFAWEDEKDRIEGAKAARRTLSHERNAVEKIRTALALRKPG